MQEETRGEVKAADTAYLRVKSALAANTWPNSICLETTTDLHPQDELSYTQYEARAGHIVSKTNRHPPEPSLTALREPPSRSAPLNPPLQLHNSSPRPSEHLARLGADSRHLASNILYCLSAFIWIHTSTSAKAGPEEEAVQAGAGCLG